MPNILPHKVNVHEGALRQNHFDVLLVFAQAHRHQVTLVPEEDALALEHSRVDKGPTEFAEMSAAELERYLIEQGVLKPKRRCGVNTDK